MITAVFILTLLNTLILVVLGLFIAFTSTGYAKRSSLEEQTQSSEELKKFYEEDRKAAQAFLSSLSELNSFMTGTDYDKEIGNVGKQDET